MKKFADSFSVSLPDGWQNQLPTVKPGNDVDKMQFVLKLARWNISNAPKPRAGGPFAAAIFDTENDRLISIGVNQVVPAKCSLAHAEAVAIALAQQRLETHDLSAVDESSFELFASGQPCVQCFGMSWWSGIVRLVIGARAADIEEIAGFDEGPIRADWKTLLKNRSRLPSVDVVTDVCRDEARSVLQAYAQNGGINYSPGRS